MLVRVAVCGHQQHGAVEYHGLPSESTETTGQPHNEAQRIILEPPGVVRDAVALVIRDCLATGACRGQVEGVYWEKLTDEAD